MNVRAVGRWSALLLTEAIGSIANSTPRRAAVSDAQGTTSYGDLAELASGCARFLTSLPSDAPTAVLLSPRAHYVAVYLAALSAGRLIIPLNDQLADREIREILIDSSAGALLTEESQLPRVRGLVAGLRSEPSVRLIESVEPAPTPELRVGLPTPRDRVVCLYGATAEGGPQGAVLTHGNLLGTVDALRHAAPVVESDVFVGLIPLWHVYGLTVGCLLPLSVGARVVLCPSGPSECPARAIGEHGGTFLVATPCLLSRLASWEGDLSVGTLRHCMCAGDVLAPEVLERFERRYGVYATEAYVCTEAAGPVTCNAFSSERKPGSVGRPLPHHHVLLVDEHDGPVPVGIVGEIVVRGPSVMACYLGRPHETREVLRDGYLHTGTLAWQDAEGYVRIVSSGRDAIVVDGLSVYPSELERVLRTFPGVCQCCVISVVDPDHGHVPKAVVVPHPGEDLSVDALRAHCEESLAAYKVPRAYQVVSQLPMTTSGLVSRATVARLYGHPL